MKRFWLACLVIGMLLTSGCETVKGVGRDMQKAGNWVEDAAK